MVENESFDEFRTRILKRNTKKDFKIKNSFWSKFLYREADKTHPIRQVKENDFLHIIREVNNCLADDLVKGYAISIPFFGIFYVKKREVKNRLEENNRLVNKRDVNWFATHKLWYEDDDAREKRTLVRFNHKYSYSVEWAKNKFPNATFFKFKPHRTFRTKLGQQIKTDNTVYIYGT